MKKLLLLPLVAAILLTAATVQAQESPELQLEFVSKLRAKGLFDLALQHLENLSKNPPPQIAPVLPLEMARTRVLLAKVKAPDERMALLKDAEKELSAYLIKKVNTSEEPQLKLEVARLTSFQGQALLAQSLRQENPAEGEPYALKARTQFAEARKKFDEAIKAIVELEKKYKGPDPKKDDEFKKALLSDMLEGKFDRAKTYIFEARTYENSQEGADKLKMAQLYKQGYNLLKDEVIDEKGNPNQEARWLAGAWAIDVARRAGEGQKAEDYYKGLTNPTFNYPKEAAAAQRLAAYYFILGVQEDHFHPPQGVAPALYIQKLGEDWVKKYKKYLDTPEGQGVQFALALSLLEQAEKASKNYTDPKAKPYYDAAQKYFEILASSHSDRAEKASQFNIKIKLKKVGEGVPVAQLKDFDEASLKARFEMNQMANSALKVRELIEKLPDAPKADEEKIKKEIEETKKVQKSNLKTAVAAFQRALQLTTPVTPPLEVEKTRYYLAYIYMASGDPYRAAVMAEYLTRKDPPSKQSPLAANYGLQAYEAILKKQDDKANQDKLTDLARFIIEDRAKQWKDEPVTATARYYLAMVFLRQKDNLKTIEQLEKLPKDFKAYTFAQCQLAQILLNVGTAAQKEGDQKKADEFRGRALATLRGIPKLPDNADQATVGMFFSIQLNQGYMLYNDAIALMRDGKEEVSKTKLEEMVSFTRGLIEHYKKFKEKLPDEAADKLEDALENLGKYARLGESRLAYKAGNYDKVLSKECTGDVIAELEMLAKGKDEIKLPDYQVTGDLLGMALRAHVQKANFAEARKVLELVQKLKSTSDLDDLQNPTTTVILKSLIADLDAQIKTLRKDKKDEAKLQQTVKNFSTFFDDLVKGKNVDQLKYNDIMFLANCYASLDQHAKAAEMYGMLPRPQLDPKDKGNKEAEEKNKKDVQLWWFLRVRSGEQLRKAKDFKKAKEVLDEVLNDPTSVGKLQAQQELNYTFEDEGNFRKGIDLWQKFMENPSLKNQMANKTLPEPTRKKAKEMYFDAYYHYVYCFYHFSQTDAGKVKEDQWLVITANFISKLKNQHDKLVAEAKKKNEELTEVTGWQIIGTRLEELLNDAPKLKSQYDKLQSTAAAASN